MDDKKKVKKNFILQYGFIFVFLVAFLLRSVTLIYSKNLGPDYQHHLVYFNYLLKHNGASPTRQETMTSPKTLTRVRHDLHEAMLQPPGFYLTIYPIYKIFPSPDTIRWFNVLLGSLTCVAVYFLLQSLILNNGLLAIFGGLFLAVQPTHVYLSTVVNNDVAIGLTSTVFLLFLIKWVNGIFYNKSGLLKLGIMVGIALGVSVWTKYSAVSLLGIWFISALFLFVSGKIKKIKDITLCLVPPFTALIFFVFLSLRNFFLGYGPLEFLSGNVAYVYTSHPPDLVRFYLTRFPATLFTSFWGGLPQHSFFIIALVKYSAILFFCYSFFLGLKTSLKNLKKFPGWIVVYSSIFIGTAAVVYWNYVGYIPPALNANARFLIPAFGSLATLFAHGGFVGGKKTFILSLFIIMLSFLFELFLPVL